MDGARFEAIAVHAPPPWPARPGRASRFVGMSKKSEGLKLVTWTSTELPLAVHPKSSTCAARRTKPAASAALLASTAASCISSRDEWRDTVEGRSSTTWMSTICISTAWVASSGARNSDAHIRGKGRTVCSRKKKISLISEIKKSIRKR